MPDASDASARTPGRLTAALHGAGTMLVVLCLGMVVGSFVLPDGDANAARYTDLDPSAPVRLVVPALKIRAPVVPVAVSQDQVLDPPQDPLQVGWWDGSAEPGQQGGQTVITGHTVHTGGGAMDSVDTLEPGQRVDVVTGKGTMRYEVSDVEVLAKDDVAAQAVSLFGQDSGNGRLVLVSCDDWNGSFYESNVIVFADPLGQPVPKKRDTTRAASR